MSVLLLIIASVSNGESLRAHEAEPPPPAAYVDPSDPFAPAVGDQPITFEGATPYLEGSPIGRMQFYTYVGRRDLAEDFAVGRKVNTGLLIGGAVAFGLAAPVIYGGWFVWYTEFVSSLGRQPGVPGILIMAGGAGLGVAGVVCALIGMLRDPDPLSEYEAKVLAVEHNRRLGAPLNGRTQAPAAPPRVLITLAPGITPRGDATLGFALSF